MKTGLNNVVRPTLFTVVNNIEQYCYTRFRLNNIVQYCWATQHCSILLIKQQAHNFYACMIANITIIKRGSIAKALSETV